MFGMLDVVQDSCNHNIRREGLTPIYWAVVLQVGIAEVIQANVKSSKNRKVPFSRNQLQESTCHFS